MEGWQDRVVEEEEGLSIKIDKLDKFLQSNEPSSVQRALLIEQRLAMKKYRHCLQKRIINFKGNS